MIPGYCLKAGLMTVSQSFQHRTKWIKCYFLQYLARRGRSVSTTGCLDERHLANVMSLGQRMSQRRFLLDFNIHSPDFAFFNSRCWINGEPVRKPGICHRLLRDGYHLLPWQPWTYDPLSVLVEPNMPFRSTVGKRHLQISHLRIKWLHL